MSTEHETQASVQKWRLEAFGAAKTKVNVLGRMVEEVAELLDAAGCGPSGREVRKRAEVLKGVVVDPLPWDVEAVADEAADVLVVLYGFCSELGIDLGAALDRKMKINRGRKWGGVGGGLGQHVERSTGQAQD